MTRLLDLHEVLFVHYTISVFPERFAVAMASANVAMKFDDDWRQGRRLRQVRHLREVLVLQISKNVGLHPSDLPLFRFPLDIF